MDIGTLTGSIAIEDQLSSHLSALTSRVKNFADNFDGTMGKLVIGSGAVLATVTAITGAVVALGNRGSDINSLSDSLDNFAGSGANANKIIDAMRIGTMGVVGDFDLLQRSTKLLAGGVKLNADGFSTLSQAAFVLQNQGLGPTKNMLELVSQAMLTGRTRSLEMAIGRIDSTKAELDYARSLGTTVKDLTAAERVEAQRNAILDALNKKIKDAGVQNRDFAATVSMVVTVVKNWFDNLSALVAKSDFVAKAVRDIGDGIKVAFGNTSETLLKNVVNSVDAFARGVSTAVPYIAEFLRIVTTVVGFLWDYRNAIEAAVAALILLKGAQIAVAYYMLLTSAATEAQTLAIYASVTAFKVAAYTAGVYGLAIAGIAAGLATLYNAGMLVYEAYQRHQAKDEQKIIDARNLATINQRLGTSYTNLADAQKKTYELGKNATTANAAAAEAAKKLAEENERVGKTAAAAKEKAAEFYQQIVNGSKELDIQSGVLRTLNKSQLENYDVLSRVVPKIFDLVGANKSLTKELTEAHARYVGMNLARNADMVEKLKEVGLTAEIIKANQDLGITMADMAVFYGVTETAINQHVAALQKELAAKQGYASFVAALYEQQAKERQANSDRELAVNKALAAFDEEYQTRRTTRYMTETQKRIDSIKREYAAQIALLSAGKTAEEAAKIREAAYRNMAQAIDEVYMAEEQESAMMAASGKLASDVLRETKAKFDEVKDAAKTAAYDGLASFFTMLGQISGSDGIGKFLGSIGGMIAGLKSANDWSNQIGGNSKEKLGGSFGSLSVMFDKNASGAQRVAAGIQSAAVIAQGAKNIWDATGASASKAQNAMNGALAGAQAGAAFGPWGIAVGAAAGLVTGLVRGKPAWAKAASEVARDFGVKISDELSKTIADNAKKDFGGNRQASALNSLADIIKEGGGVNAGNVAGYTSKLRDVFSMVETGAMTSAQAVKVLDENFGSLVKDNTDSLGFWSTELKEIIALNERFGTSSKAIIEAQRQQAAIVVQGFNAIMTGTTKARQGYADLAKSIVSAKDEIKKLNEEPERGRGSEWTKKMEEAQAKLKAATQAQQAASKGATRELTDLGTVAVASFAVATANGASFYEALMAAQPGLSDLRHAYEDLGMDIEDPFMKMLLIQSRVMEQQPELIQGVQGMGAQLAAMSNLNMLNADTFAAMGRLAGDSYARIQAEVAAAGGSTRDALMPMQSYLQAAAKASKELGLPLDENTQMMIDQSKELGIWKDVGPTAAEAMQAATEKLTGAIEKLIAMFDRIPDSLPDPFAGWNLPAAPVPARPGFDEGGTVGKTWKKRSSRDVIPAWLREGEVVVTPEQMRAPRPMMTADASGSSQPQMVQLIVDGKKMADVVINRAGGRLALGGVR